MELTLEQFKKEKEQIEEEFRIALNNIAWNYKLKDIDVKITRIKHQEFQECFIEINAIL